MKATEIFRQKMVLKHEDGVRLAIFEVAIFSIPISMHYPEGPHLHIGSKEVGYVFRGISELKADVVAMIKKAGFVYEE